MWGPIILPIALTVAGVIAGGWAGAVVGTGVGLLVDAAVVVGASLWMRRIGVLLEPEEAWEHLPRPPGFSGLVEWVAGRGQGMLPPS